MARMLMASSTTTTTKPLLTNPSTPTPTIITPKPKHLSFESFLPNLKITLKTLATTVPPLTLPYLLPHASLAAEIEKAQLFDFDLTLPIMMSQFLLLMFALDKIYYTPAGEFMDKRDADIKAKLANVQDTSTEVKQLEDQANAVMRAARAEIAAALNKMKMETTEEVEAQIEEARKKTEAELVEALAALEMQKDETIVALDAQIATLSQDIVDKILPAAV